MTGRLGILKLSEQNQDQHDNEYEAEPAATVVAGPIKRAAPEPAKAPEQRDYQNDEQDGSERHNTISVFGLWASLGAHLTTFAPRSDSCRNGTRRTWEDCPASSWCKPCGSASSWASSRSPSPERPGILHRPHARGHRRLCGSRQAGLKHPGFPV